MFRLSGVLAFGLLVSVGCQSYQARPLDDAEIRFRWQSMDIEGEAAGNFARRVFESTQASEEVYDPADGISLLEAEVIALMFNPKLRVARAESRIPFVKAGESGNWQDPEFGLDASRILESVSSPWIVGLSLQFTIPLSGRREAKESQLYAEYASQVARLRLLEADTRKRLRIRWAELVAEQDTIELLRYQEKEITEIWKVARRLADAGEIPRSEERLFEIRLAELRQDIVSHVSEQRLLHLRLFELMGLVPEAEYDLVVEGPWREWNDDADVRASIETNNLELQLARAEYDVSEKALYLEIRKQYPDLTIGPQFESDAGESSIGLGLGLLIPMINLNKEGIAEAHASREAAYARYEEEYRGVFASFARLSESLEKVRGERRSLSEEIAPLVDAQLDEIRQQAELGVFDALMLFDALTRHAEAKQSIILAQRNFRIGQEELKAVVGPDAVTVKPDPQVE